MTTKLQILIEVVDGGFIVDHSDDLSIDNRQVFTSKAKVVKFIRDTLAAVDGSEETAE